MVISIYYDSIFAHISFYTHAITMKPIIEFNVELPII